MIRHVQWLQRNHETMLKTHCRNGFDGQGSTMATKLEYMWIRWRQAVVSIHARHALFVIWASEGWSVDKGCSLSRHDQQTTFTLSSIHAEWVSIIESSWQHRHLVKTTGSKRDPHLNHQLPDILVFVLEVMLTLDKILGSEIRTYMYRGLKRKVAI